MSKYFETFDNDSDMHNFIECNKLNHKVDIIKVDWTNNELTYETVEYEFNQYGFI